MIPGGVAEAELRDRARNESRSFRDFRDEDGYIDPFYDEEDDQTEWEGVDLGGFPRGLDLVGVCFRVVWKDKEILLYQTFAMTLALSVLLLFFVAIVPSWDTETIAATMDDPGFLFKLFPYYIIAAFIGVYFKAASVAVATIRIKGGNPTVYDGLEVATKKIISLLGWAIIVAFVGFILALLKRRGRGSRTAAQIGELAWGIATYFAIPVLLFEDCGAIDAIFESGSIVKRTWRESLAGNFGMSLPFILLFLLGFFTVAPIGMAFGGMAGLVLSLITYWVIIGIISASTSAVLVAALYRLARTGLMPEGFDAYEEFGTRFSTIRPYPSPIARDLQDTKYSPSAGMRARF